jgi:hypothetical protein
MKFNKCLIMLGIVFSMPVAAMEREYTREYTYEDLNKAIDEGKDVIVRYLIERGLNIRQFPEGENPVERAGLLRHVSIVRLLIFNGARFWESAESEDIAKTSFQEPLLKAIIENNRSGLKSEIKRAKKKNPEQLTEALELAAAIGDVPIVELLVQNNALPSKTLLAKLLRILNSISDSESLTFRYSQIIDLLTTALNVDTGLQFPLDDDPLFSQCVLRVSPIKSS